MWWCQIINWLNFETCTSSTAQFWNGQSTLLVYYHLIHMPQAFHFHCYCKWGWPNCILNFYSTWFSLSEHPLYLCFLLGKTTCMNKLITPEVPLWGSGKQKWKMWWALHHQYFMVVGCCSTHLVWYPTGDPWILLVSTTSTEQDSWSY